MVRSVRRLFLTSCPLLLLLLLVVAVGLPDVACSASQVSDDQHTDGFSTAV
jgi:hypothetical protein